MAKDKELHKTKIGGQALIEGIMMKGPEKGALAVKQKNGEIYTEVWTLKEKKWYRKAPFIRGVINFTTQMADGYKYISKSAEKSGMLEDEEEETKFEKWLTKVFGESITNILMGIAMVLGICFAVVLFLFVPTWIFTFISGFAGENDISNYRSLVEGFIKITIFIIYLWLTSRLKDIRRTYEYHGAEHKTIAAYEAGLELTVENVKSCRRFHPRCGTSFIFLTLGLSILLYSIVPINSELFIQNFGVEKFAADAMRVAAKFLLLPILVAVSYELHMLGGRVDNVLMRIVTAPGLLIQRLTTKEPDESQIEIAIAAMNPVIPLNKELDKW